MPDATTSKLTEINVAPLTNEDIEGVREVSLPHQQVKFAGTADEFLAEDSETIHRHVIKRAGETVGFFKLDTDYTSQYDFCPPKTLGLRMFVVDARYQGQGLGTGAVKALLKYLPVAYRDFNWVYLTVNCQNPAAKACYQKGGFTDTGELYWGGAAGPQHIMYAAIDADNKGKAQ
ncbi:MULTISPECIES: GNAT family N-acetyltransferase [Salinivibrio]|uniref:GNAT family N-acetyltransferase n=1 Tax=Salinivibrio costicola subsp. alcaliphilus TaxID=272773 RepID=A0ABX3KNA0_SALCS|nr:MULTISPECIES: GNAT family N-acetyltransferase [Salinivibrio]NUY54989.1 GNAT family N-acetyltransferase [Salinivibrio sp. EAGSL]OOF33186.1 GNAT family N-acetyltransferase [Salinivibrio costicola subsp. alcaliphilus]